MNVNAIGEAIMANATINGNNMKKHIKQQQQFFNYLPKKHGETSIPPTIAKADPATQTITRPINNKGKINIKPIILKNAFALGTVYSSLKNSLFSKPSTH